MCLFYHSKNKKVYVCVWMNDVGGGGSSNLYSKIFPTQNGI